MSAAADTRRSVVGTAANSCCRNRSFEHSVAGQRPARHLDSRPMTGPVTCELTLSTHCRLSRRRDGCQQWHRKRPVTSGQGRSARATRVECRSAVVPVGRQSPRCSGANSRREHPPHNQRRHSQSVQLVDSHLSRRASGSWMRGTRCSAAVVAAAKAVVAAWVEEQHRTRQPQPVCPGPGCSARAQRAQVSGQLCLRFKLESRRVGTVALAASATPFMASRRRERKGVSVDHWPPRTARAATAKPFRPLKTKPLLKMTPHA